MTALRFLAAGVAFILGSWLVFDGTRAFVKGDYVTPSSGPYAGKLGPWSRVVSAVGLEPRSSLVKGLHVFLGVCWLAALGIFLWRPAAGWRALLGMSVASTWYLPVGTVLSVLEIIILLSLR